MRLHRFDAGTGDPAVFIHGSMGWGVENFPGQLSLSSERRIVVVDRAGYGGSAVDGELGWRRDVDEIVAVLEEVGGAHLVGVSYGGADAILVALRRPDLVRSLVAIEPALYSVAAHLPTCTEVLRRAATLAPARSESEVDILDYMPRWFSVLFLDDDADGVRTWVTDLPTADRAAVSATCRERFSGDAEVDLSALAALEVPKVVAVGGWNVDGGSALAGTIYAEIAQVLVDRAGFERVVFEASTHNPQLDEPDAFNELLRRCWSSAGGAVE